MPQIWICQQCMKKQLESAQQSQYDWVEQRYLAFQTQDQVSTIKEVFFNEHFRPPGKTLLPTGDWLRLTPANGLEILYVGYLELDIEALGVMIPQRGILVVKSPAGQEARQHKKKIPGLIGMNIITQLHEPFKNGKAETSSEWSKVLKITSSAQSISVCGFAKIAGKSQIRVPAGSVSVLRINGWQGPQTRNTAAIEWISARKPCCHQYSHPCK